MEHSVADKKEEPIQNQLKGYKKPLSWDWKACAFESSAHTAVELSIGAPVGRLLHLGRRFLDGLLHIRHSAGPDKLEVRALSKAAAM